MLLLAAVAAPIVVVVPSRTRGEKEKKGPKAREANPVENRFVAHGKISFCAFLHIWPRTCIGLEKVQNFSKIDHDVARREIQN